MKLRHSLLVTTGLFVVAVMTPVLANAQSTQVDEMNTQIQEKRETTQRVTETRQEKREEMQAQISDRREVAEGRLEAAKLKACQNRQKAIENILARLSNRGDKRLDVFTKIADRVQVFYGEQGNTLNSYDELVADVVAKKATAEEAVTNLHNTAGMFSCEGEDPKGAISIFREQLEARNVALREYKTAVKNLILGVKSAQPTEAAENTQEGGQE